mmetsp:Transcript_2252/g.2639  ORF Transcript_2252/g.2639 Transcript_2252/m.2639 type:complete len:352 (+) Transcript_2252:27-1082(+)|eukprot:CAMPEP_0205822140 /NCGR_PEP_ID=MMETSP0206-20130828/11035_1 /ASSEMBLY_ACC=CAM_ASM_000279 /TAXON_ID=36767 /ORGANISM="Euplotes focardii, Strain TN1" /LENGTH=351 /DNA_ID=CAMNT_0053118155 /DNA_START=27 /DNA_END=1082 /DNA_ORIENTATION=+
MADAQPYLEKTVRDQLVKALQALYREQPAKPFTFLSEFFAAAKAAAPPAEEQKKQAPKGKKKKKKVKIAKSDVTIEVTLDTEVEATWDQIKADIRKIDLHAVMWPPLPRKFGLVDFVFGMKKLIVMCQIVNAEVPATAPIVDAIKEVKGVGEANMVNIETAADNWGNKPKSKKNKGGKGGNKGKKGKKGKKKPAGPSIAELTAKDVTKVSLLAKEASFYVAGCSNLDGSGQRDVTPEQLRELATKVRAKLPMLGLMLVSAGSSEVTAFAMVPKGSALNATEWAAAALGSGKASGDASSGYITKVCDPDQDEFCIKVKDFVSANAFAFLRKAGVLEEASEDEFFGGDDEEGY